MISVLSSYMADFHFLRPWYLLLLIIPFVFYRVIYKDVENLSSWEKVCDKNLLKYLLIKGRTSQRRLSVFLMYLGLIFAVFAIAGPSFRKEKTPVLMTENPVMILLNLSSDEKKEDKLTRAKIEISDLMQKIPAAESGLIVYTDEPFVISPLSNDPNLIVNLLKAVDTDIMPVNGDRLDRAIDFAVQKINDAGYLKGQIVVFSDSGGVYAKQAVDMAQKAAQKQIFVSTVSLSKKINDDLYEVASAGKGVATDLSEDAAEIVAQKINRIQKEVFKQSQNFNENWVDEGWYLIFVPMLCCLYFFRRGVLFIFILFLGIKQAQAGLIWSQNQEGQKLFEQNQFEAAAEHFEDPSWKASAYYRAGNYEQAAAFFKGEDTESLYNRANAFAKGGKIEEAVKLYEQVLKDDPKHEDARFNLEYLKQQQNQNQREQNQKQNKDQDNDQQNDQQQNQSQNSQDKENQSEDQKQDKNDQQNNDDQNQENNEQNQGSDAQNKEQKENQPEDQTQGENNQQNENQSAGENQLEERKNEDQFKEKQESNEQIEDKAGEQRKGENDAFGVSKERKENQSENFDEQIQAREQKFREIPEDKGGLLKAFILKEYLKNRYGDEK